jgi:hypothetical protein
MLFGRCLPNVSNRCGEIPDLRFNVTDDPAYFIKPVGHYRHQTSIVA